ncbi:MAG: DUF4384 domain-containing protein, partial [Gemmatimonadaceae bacterium]
MPRFTRVGSGILGLAMPLVVGCVSSGVSPGHARYRSDDFARLLDSAQAAAPERAGKPRVHIITPGSLAASGWVESAFRVSEDAYVTLVAVDYDGRARVIFPEAPSESGFARANTLYRLPRFFAGFGTQRLASFAGSRYRMSGSSFGRTSGLIFAIASDRPLQLQRIATDDGEWDTYAIERILWGRSYSGGGYALGKALALTGQEFNTEFSGFTLGTSHPGYMFASVDSPICDGGSWSFFDQLYSPEVSGISYVDIDGVRYARFAVINGCTDFVRYQLVPLGPVQRIPRSPADTARTDSSSTQSASRIARAAYIGSPLETGSNAFVDRPAAHHGTIGSADDGRDESATRRPRLDRGLRFLPPERVRDDGRILRAGEASPQDETARERQIRRIEDARGRPAAPQSEPAHELPTRAETPRPEAAAIEPTTPSSGAGSAAHERTVK